MPASKFCASPWVESVLRFDGTLKACCKNYTVLGNWMADGLQGAWLSPDYVGFRKKIVEGEYPDDFCRVCHSNGTAPSLRQLLQRSIHEYGRMTREAGAPGLSDLAQLLTILTKKERDEEFDKIVAAARGRCALWRSQIKNAHLPEYAALFVSKFEKIITIIEDFVAGNVRPSTIAPFRQGNLIAICNARCIHCPGLFTGGISEGARIEGSSERFKEMPASDVDPLFQHEDDIIDFFLNGSEFLFAKTWEDIAKRLRAQGVRLRFSTNGMLLTQRNADILIKRQYLGKLNVSLDGGTEAAIEAVRVRVKYARVMENLDYLLRLAAAQDYSFIFSLSFALMTVNYRTLPDFVELAARLRDKNPNITPSIMVQPLVKKGVRAYGEFFDDHHPSRIDHSELSASFREMEVRAESLKIPVFVFFTYGLKDFIARGCPIPNRDFVELDQSHLEE